MNKNEKFFLIQKLASLSTYSELLPDEFKDKYKEDLESVRKFISEYKVIEDKPKPVEPEAKPTLVQEKTTRDIFVPREPDELEEHHDEAPAKLVPPPKPNLGMAPPPPRPNMLSQTLNNKQGFVNYLKTPPTPPNSPSGAPIPPPNTVQQNQAKEKKSTFEFVTSGIVPKLTEDRKKIMGDLSFPINLYMIIKIIDDKSNLFKLFEKYYKQNGGSFVEFSESLYQLDQRKCLSFVRTVDNVSKDSGLIRIEEFFSEGKIISEENMSKATEVMKTTGGVFIAKTLIGMRLLTEESLGNCVKIQKWLGRVFEKSPYSREELEIKPKAPEPIQSKVVENLPKQDGVFLPQAIIPVVEEVVEVDTDPYNIMEFIISSFNEKGQEIISSPEHQELAKRISIVRENKTLFQNYVYNKDNFKKNKFAFMKFVAKLDSQEIFNYKDNVTVDEKPIWARFGELLITLGLCDEEQLQQAIDYKEEHNTYIGDAFVQLNIIDEPTLQECLKIQHWLNKVLSDVCFETAFVDVIKNVLMESFRCKVDIGGFQRISFTTPIKDIVYIKYPITGKLNGWIYYISDRNFMNSLARTMMNSIGAETGELDESYVGTVSSVIISNSLSKLTQKGLFNAAEMAKILMEKEVKMNEDILVANGNQVAMIPLINQFGRFAICLEVR
ncbi:MAG: hypothetical protein U0457_12205 [Candidatus Sericytochromatia bacterium]